MTTTPASNMEKLSPEVFLYRPGPQSLSTTSNHDTVHPSSQASSASHSPKLILLATWSGALDGHITKYISKYQTLYPTAQILLIKSTFKLFFNPHLVGKAVEPAIPVIKACFPSESASSSAPIPIATTPGIRHEPDLSERSPELLIHVFSMGGTSTLVRLLEAYSLSTSSQTVQSQPPSGAGDIFPPHITILDSCPTILSPPSVATFLLQPLPFPIRILAGPLIYTLSYTWGFLVSVGLLSDPLARWGDALNGDLNRSEVRRAYIYSDGDELIDPNCVEVHAGQAQEKGFTIVRKERFGRESKHVQHARVDGGRYWGVVTEAWDGVDT